MHHKDFQFEQENDQSQIGRCKIQLLHGNNSLGEIFKHFRYWFVALVVAFGNFDEAQSGLSKLVAVRFIFHEVLYAWKRSTNDQSRLGISSNLL